MSLHENISIGEKYKPAMEIKDQQKAEEYFEILVQHTMSFGSNREEAIQIEKSNLGYYSGYYDNETQERVQTLFKCSHPIFGSIKTTPEDAFKKGFEMGKQINNQLL